MHRVFPPYRIWIKILFLGMSIILLISALSYRNTISYESSAKKIFTVDRAADIDMQINSIERYLAGVTGQAIGLNVRDAGITTTLLPATSDYNLYRTYLYTITHSELKTKNNDEGRMTNDPGKRDPSVTINPTVRTMNTRLGVSVVSFILALFL